MFFCFDSPKACACRTAGRFNGERLRPCRKLRPRIITLPARYAIVKPTQRELVQRLEAERWKVFFLTSQTGSLGYSDGALEVDSKDGDSKLRAPSSNYVRTLGPAPSSKLQASSPELRAPSSELRVGARSSELPLRRRVGRSSELGAPPFVAAEVGARISEVGARTELGP